MKKSEPSSKNHPKKIVIIFEEVFVEDWNLFEFGQNILVSTDSQGFGN